MLRAARAIIDLLVNRACSFIYSTAPSLAASAALQERGFLVPAIRYPTVPRGSARLRVALSAAHRTEDIAALQEALRETVSGWHGHPAHAFGGKDAEGPGTSHR